jgi:16S rRNA (uracil1498-N3)-methyltransferase
MKNQHEFAIYFPHLSTALAHAQPNQLIKIEDADLAHRLERVLRLQQGEICLLFDARLHARCEYRQAIGKQKLELFLIEFFPNRTLTPELTVWLPLLKRDDLQEAIYSLVELGATAIRLLITHKVQRSWGGPKEFDRLERIMIAAAEQSKNFTLPQLFEPVSFETFLAERNVHAPLIFFDPLGQSLMTTLLAFQNQKITHLDVLIGPEGDLTDAEKQRLQESGAIFCALTPTILRACQAVAVGVGALRASL